MPRALGGHSLKRGAMNTAKNWRAHLAQLEQLGRHRSYATLVTYIEERDLFEDNAWNGVLYPLPCPTIRPAGCRGAWRVRNA
jgi:hypothetical protein